MLVISGYGTHLLKTESDLSWFLPTDSYFARFLNTQETFFGKGIAANLYIGKWRIFWRIEMIENLSSIIDKILLSGYHLIVLYPSM